MKYICVIVLSQLILSCSKDKSVLLPEIQNASITEITDISPAYIFYDETQPDSVELNRKNLIGTTNWLFNVDKRLTLEQAMPKIMFLQDKKRNKQMHKNENARNYFTCSDTSIKNLGFIDFTDVIYNDSIPENIYALFEKEQGVFTSGVLINILSQDSISVDVVSPTKPLDSTLNELSTDMIFKKIASKELERELNTLRNDSILTILQFNKRLKFQSYIDIKARLSKLNENQFVIYNNEFIY
ncbi:MAG: hypothetical protein HRU26_12975 [Psychroserpens sp.]|nr:hypothetical protein [Psychroserpens sp.]